MSYATLEPLKRIIVASPTPTVLCTQWVRYHRMAKFHRIKISLYKYLSYSSFQGCTQVCWKQESG